MTRGSYSGSANPNWRGGHAGHCAECGAPVWIKPSRASHKHYCGKACMAAGFKKEIGATSRGWKGGPITVECTTCKRPFTRWRAELERGRGRFCSVRCMAESRRVVVTPEMRVRRRLNNSMTVLMHRELGRAKAGRRWTALAGYSVDELRAHLERLFQPGMSWETSGEWHIDHVRPRASFRFTSAEDEQFKACWALSNLQPLWAADNIRKGSRLLSVAA